MSPTGDNALNNTVCSGLGEVKRWKGNARFALVYCMAKVSPGNIVCQPNSSIFYFKNICMYKSTLSKCPWGGKVRMVSGAAGECFILLFPFHIL